MTIEVYALHIESVPQSLEFDYKYPIVDYKFVAYLLYHIFFAFAIAFDIFFSGRKQRKASLLSTDLPYLYSVYIKGLKTTRRLCIYPLPP